MAITSYLSTTEATERFPGDASYTAAQKASALEQSFSLVNSFLDSKLKVPVVTGWDGETTQTEPYCLKVIQGMFYQYLLQTSNNGYTEELIALYDKAVEMAKAITQNEMSVPEAMTFAVEVGWNIVKVTQVAGYEGKGGVWVRGAAPGLRTYLRIVVAGVAGKHSAAGGHVDDGDFTFSIYRGDTATVVSSANVPYYDWHSYSDGDYTFEMRWDGEWGAASEVRIIGVPASEVNQPTINPNTMSTAPVSY